MYKILITILLTSTIWSQTTQWRLLWDKNLDSDFPNGGGWYHIYKSTSSIPIDYVGDPYQSLDYIPRAGYVDTTMQYIDTSLPKGQQIYYRLKAENDYGMSDFSIQVSSEIPLLAGSDTLKANTVSAPFYLTLTSEKFGANLHLWQVASSVTEIVPAIDNTGRLDVTFPWGWSGEAILTVVVSNPDEFYDQKNYIFKVEAVYPNSVGKPTLEAVQPVPQLSYP